MILRVKCSPDIRTVSTTICKIVFWRKKLIAENEGFEPPICCHIHAFQACSLNHSDNSPLLLGQRNYVEI